MGCIVRSAQRGLQQPDGVVVPDDVDEVAIRAELNRCRWNHDRSARLTDGSKVEVASAEEAGQGAADSAWQAQRRAGGTAKGGGQGAQNSAASLSTTP